MNKFYLLFLYIPFILYSANTSFAQYANINSFVSQEQTVNGFSNTFLGVNYAEPYIATNPRNPLNTICTFISGSYFTLDGLNWKSLNALNNSDPFIAFDSLGNAYYASLFDAGNTVYYYLRKSTDNGNSWSSNQTVAFPSDKECICANQSGGPFSNHLYSGWQWSSGLDQDNLYFARSTNVGSNWTIQTVGVNIGYCPYIAIGPSINTPGGIIYYGYNSYDSVLNVFNIHIKKSTVNGISFSQGFVISTFTHPAYLKNAVGANACIQMSADNGYGTYRGNVYIVYTGHGVGADKADIFFLKSSNYGDNWSAPIKLNDDNTLNDQWMPSITVDKNGKVYITWYDSRFDAQNIQTLLYGTLSTNGGTSFVPDFPISNTPFNPVPIAVNGFIGHYNSVSAIGNTALAAWTDGRNNNFGSYVSYFPDFAMKVNPESVFLHSNDSMTAVIKIPAANGSYIGNEKFTYSIDTLPSQGNITLNFLNKDSISTIPDSIYLKIKLTNVTVSGSYRVNVAGRNTGNGVPAHKRYIDLFVNSSLLNIGTNRNNLTQFKVDAITYNNQQNLVMPNGYHTVQAISPANQGNNVRYIYLNWSDNGDTTHTININTNTNLTAYYKTQFRFVLLSSVGNTFGQEGFYDSSQTVNYGVLSKVKLYNGQVYHFKGWDGAGTGSYTSPDSTGNDTTITLNMSGYIIESARWITTVGIKSITGEIPKEYKLFQNYPNPFNPTTKIRYQIPYNGFVILKVYSILGREVETLVNEKLNAGTYEVTFNASQYPSGVYFYRLQAGDFTDVKKLLFVK